MAGTNPYQYPYYNYAPYPSTYTSAQPYYPSAPTYTPTPAYQQAPPNDASQGRMRMDWVKGRSGAEAYRVGANETVWLMDTEDQMFYVKSADANGVPSFISICRYEEQLKLPETKQDNGAAAMPEYATKADVEDLKKLIEELTK